MVRISGEYMSQTDRDYKRVQTRSSWMTTSLKKNNSFRLKDMFNKSNHSRSNTKIAMKEISVAMMRTKETKVLIPPFLSVWLEIIWEWTSTKGTTGTIELSLTVEATNLVFTLLKSKISLALIHSIIEEKWKKTKIILTLNSMSLIEFSETKHQILI